MSTGFGSIGVFGADGSSDGGLLNVGVEGVSNGAGVVAASFASEQAEGTRQYPALQAFCFGGGPAIVAASGATEPADDVMTLDCAGNLAITGTPQGQSFPRSNRSAHRM